MIHQKSNLFKFDLRFTIKFRISWLVSGSNALLISCIRLQIFLRKGESMSCRVNIEPFSIPLWLFITQNLFLYSTIIIQLFQTSEAVIGTQELKNKIGLRKYSGLTRSDGNWWQILFQAWNSQRSPVNSKNEKKA